MYSIKSDTRLEKLIYVTTQPTIIKRTYYYVLPICFTSVLQKLFLLTTLLPQYL